MTRFTRTARRPPTSVTAIVLVAMATSSLPSCKPTSKTELAKRPNILLIVADASRRGLQAGLRINDLAKNLNIGVARTCLMINQAKGSPPEAVMDIIRSAELEFVGTVLEDDTLYEYDLNGQPTIEMPMDTPSVRAAFAIFDKLLT